MSPLARLIGIAAVLIALTSVTPFAFRTLGDNAYIALTMVAALFTIVATRVAERIPADPALTSRRDATIFPHINRVDTAATIYPPVAQFFFLIVTRFGENVTTMRLP